MFCPQCKADYGIGVTGCPNCGVELIDHLPSDPPPGLEDHPDLVVVRTYLNAFDADVAKTALEAAGIESMSRSDDSGGQYPGLAFTQGIELLVRLEDVDEANEILSVDAADAAF